MHELIKPFITPLLSPERVSILPSTQEEMYVYTSFRGSSEIYFPAALQIRNEVQRLQVEIYWDPSITKC